MNEVIDRFISLFQGNQSVIGTEEGGCKRLHGDDLDINLHIERHLTGEGPPVGVYPMTLREDRTTLDWRADSWQVHWGAIDFDEGEYISWVHALNVQNLLAVFDVQSHVERSRSKGYHVIVFAEEWTEAATMRHALLAACQVVDAPTREINPKQTELEPGQIGNYLRLCYPGALNDDVTPIGYTDDGRRMVVDSGRGSIGLNRWLDGVVETPVANLDALAALYEPPMKRRPKLDPSVYAPDADQYLTPYLRKAYDEGPGEDVADRSATLWRFACLLAESGRVPEEAAVELATSYDAKWLAKFTDRLDGESRIEALVSKAYG